MSLNNRELAPLALVGIGCRFPGGSDSPEQFWDLICRGRLATGNVPPGRWDLRRFYSADKNSPGKSIACKGSFLRRPIDEFDAGFFGISPREAAPMDPQQRLLLEVTWEAVEGAGLVMDHLRGSRVGVFIGAFGADNQLLQMSRGGRYLAGPYTIAGCSAAMLSNRLSYTFNFTGPSLTIDTACSSSLVALHYASQSLWNGECELALAGGVNLMFHPDFAIGLAKARFLSADGRCKAFDQRADGYGRGEGAGVVVLKPLAKAVADGDPIRALIRATGVNQDGQTPGITVPSGEAQARLMREVCRRAGIATSSVQYVEAHGTGTAVGDPIEAHAIGESFGRGRDDRADCYLGSVKANIGHLEAAAGIAGVIKAVLCLEHKQIPPHPLLEGPNPVIPFADLSLRLPHELLPWPESTQPALAAVNSFGFGGTNAHVVLQEAPPTNIDAPVFDLGDGIRQPHLLTLSARCQSALTALARSYCDQGLGDNGHESPTIRDLCYSASVRSSHHSHRLAVVVQSSDELQEKLRAFAEGSSVPGARAGIAALERRRPRLAFVFSGMGPQWWGMGRELLRDEPVFRATIERIDQIFRVLAGWSLLDEFAVSEHDSRVAFTEVAQPLSFAVQVALVALWRSWGIAPDGVVGHSVGEVAAAHVAGMLDLEDAVKLSFHRSRVQARARGKGAMLAVGLAAAEAQRRLNGLADRAVIAAVNSRTSCTVAGDLTALGDLAEILTGQNVFNRLLKVDIAYHSPQMDPLEPELKKALEGLEPHLPEVPLYSTVTGRQVESAHWDVEYWWRNVRQPVEFAAAISEMIAQGYDIFLEIGAHPVLASSISESLREAGKAGVVLGSLSRQQPERSALLDSLGGLHVAGYPIDWRQLYPGGGRLVRLPRYPWQRERHWCESLESREDRLGGGVHPLLDRPLRAPLPTWQVELTSALFPYLVDHRIEDTPVFPGSGYVEACIAMALAVEGRPTDPVVVEDLCFRKALVVGQGEAVCLHIGFDTEERLVSIHGRLHGNDEPWTLRAAGAVRERRASVAPSPVVSLEDLRDRCPLAYAPDALYRKLHAVGLDYGPMFQAIEGLWLGQGEVVAEIGLPRLLATEIDRYHLHPVLLDASFQALFAAALGEEDNVRALGQNLYLPVKISRVAFYRAGGSRIWCHGRIREITSHNLIGDIRVFDESGQLLAEISGFQCQALKSRNRSDADRFNDLLYDIQWQLLPALAFDGTESLTPDSVRSQEMERIESLIFADQGGTGGALAAELRRQEQDPIVVVAGNARLQLGARHFQIDPSRPEDMDWLLEQVGGQVSCRRIIYSWGLDVDDATGCLELSDKQAGLDDCVVVMHLVQSVERSNWCRPPRLWLLTRSAVQVDPHESRVVPGQASLWGLGRVIEMEHPELRCSLLDLENAAPVAIASSIAAELAADSPETEVAYRAGARHGLRVVRATRSRACVEKPVTVNDPSASYRLELKRTGSFDNLFFRECVRQDPGPDEVEVRVKATGLNYKDVLKVMGVLSDDVVRDTWSGHTLGLECAGVITRVGRGVSPQRVGAEVQGWVADGFRTYITATADQFVPRFEGLSSDEAAAVPVVFLTAYYGLKEIARLQAGERVLIHAATGGVGLAAIQVARALGAEVFATAGSPDKRDYLHSLGIQHVMDSRSLEFADRILDRTQGRGVDVVLNSLTGEALAKSLSVLAPYGRFIEIGKRDIDADHALRLKPFNRNLLFAAIDLDRLLVDRPGLVGRLQEELRELFRQRLLKPLPITVYPAERVEDAFRFLAQARHIGKVVVSYDSPGVSLAPLLREPVRIRPDATYLITGGCGGFGLETARWLADHGARALVLVGRRGAVSAEAIEAVATLESRGVQVMVAAADVTDSARLAELLRQIAATLPPLRGVFHSAMALDDELLDRLDASRYRTPMSAKILGAWNLHAQTLDLPLDMFVLYSSMVAILGNLGQAGYASANAYLDALACYRQALGLPAFSINWGSLAEVGFVARSPAVARFLERTGMFALPATQALDVMGSLLDLGRAGIGVAQLDWSVWAQAVPNLAARPRFETVLGRSVTSQAGRESESPRAMAVAILEAAPEGRHSVAAGILRDIIGKVLRLPASKLDLDQNINHLGIDSLMAVELQTLVAEQTGAHFSPVDFMAGSSIMTMASRLLEKLSPGDNNDSVTGPIDMSVERAILSTSENTQFSIEQSPTSEPAQRLPFLSVPDVDRLSEAELDDILTRMMSQETHL
jgi:acyl transferase domain-containing protein/NAD(P)-dependent dehydrogenase (short-subunit alcohol dehydrogenase family)/acyl carrier protein